MSNLEVFLNDLKKMKRHYVEWQIPWGDVLNCAVFLFLMVLMALALKFSPADLADSTGQDLRFATPGDMER